MRTAARLAPAALLLAFAVLFDRGLLTVRVSELGFLLGEAAGAEQVLNSLTIWGKFELLKGRLVQGEARVENEELEARLQAFTVPRDPPPRPGEGMHPGVSRALTGVVNAVRFLQGKPAIHPGSADETLRGLEAAYLEERGRRYRDALADYGEVLPRLRAGSVLEANALLHVAFCHSMLNEIPTARSILASVVSAHRGTDAGILAWKFLDFLDLLEERRQAAFPGPATELEKARQAYLLVDYPAAVSLLSAWIERHPGGAGVAEALYFRARSREEMGELAAAEADYTTVVSLPSAGRWARDAQRRLFLLSTIYGEDGQLARDALAALAAYDDRAFVEAIRPSAAVLGTGSLAAWPAQALRTPGRREAPVAFLQPAASSLPQHPVAADGQAGGVPAEPPGVLSPEPAPAGELESPASGGPVAEVGLSTTAQVPVLPELPAPGEGQPVAPVVAQPVPPVDWRQIAALESDRGVLQARLEQEKRTRARYNGWSWVSLGTGITTMGSMGYFTYHAFDSYAQYKAATGFAQAKALRQATQLSQAVAIVSGVVGGIASVATVVLQVLPPHPARTQAEIDAVDAAIARLRGETP